MKKLIILSTFLFVFFMYHDASAIKTIKHINKSATCDRNALVQNRLPKGKSARSGINAQRMTDVFKLGSEINKVISCEYPLYVSEINSGLIYFTEFKKGDVITNREFFFSKYDSITSSWEKPINIRNEYSRFCEVNKKMNFEEIFIAIDNDIYKVNFKSEVFSMQKININSKGVETSPVLSADGGTIYFISDRKGGYGGNDIWASERLSTGNWSLPYNLGKEINTIEDEESPYLMSDGATLYFSSKGHYSYGGYDVFVSTRNNDGLWSALENLGPPVNSTSDDYYYVADSYGNMAYYSSDKLDKNNQDIYVVKYKPLI